MGADFLRGLKGDGEPNIHGQQQVRTQQEEGETRPNLPGQIHISHQMDAVQDNNLQHILHSDSRPGAGSGHNCRGEGFLGVCMDRQRFSRAPGWLV